MLNPDFYGKIFHVSYETQSKNKKLKKLIVSDNLITEQHGVHIFDETMKNEKGFWHPSDIKKVEADGCNVIIATNSNTFHYLCDSSKKASHLRLALTLKPNTYETNQIELDRYKVMAFQTLDAIEPRTIKLYSSKIEEKLKSILKIFNCSEKYIPEFNVIFACLMYLRFKNLCSVFDVQVKFLFEDFQTAIVRILLEALYRISSHDFNNEYYSLHANNIAYSISLLTVLPEDEVKKINTAAQSMSGPSIMKAIENSLMLVKALENKSYMKYPILNDNIYQKLLDYTITAYFSAVLGVYTNELDDIAKNMSILVSQIKKMELFSGTMIELQKSVMTCSKEVLRLWDGKRFEPKFHLIYCIWCLKFMKMESNEKAMLIAQDMTFNLKQETSDVPIDSSSTSFSKSETSYL